MKINGMEFPISKYREWNKRFAKGEHYLEITPTGELDDYGKEYWWSDRAAYNVTSTFVDRVKIACEGVTDDQLYGVDGLVDRLRPFQLEYDSIHNTVSSYLRRIANPSCSVEDGSLDYSELEEEGVAPGKTLVYRQGANPPQFMPVLNLDLGMMINCADAIYAKMNRIVKAFINVFNKETADYEY